MPKYMMRPANRRMRLHHMQTIIAVGSGQVNQFPGRTSRRVVFNFNISYQKVVAECLVGRLSHTAAELGL